MADGDNLRAGVATNFAESTTKLFYETRNGKDFNGNFALEVVPNSFDIPPTSIGGIAAISETGIAVQGISGGLYAVAGRCKSQLGMGVIGLGGISGIYGSSQFHGVVGKTDNPSNGFACAGLFLGRVHITGDLTVNGLKSAAVSHSDGSYRRLYCVESPECWFEDFGEGTLTDGKSCIMLDSDFTELVDCEQYHVFLTAYGNSNGLYISHRCNTYFDVEEQNGGASSLKFSYRIVAKRKDVAAERLPVVDLPEVPEPPEIVEPSVISEPVTTAPIRKSRTEICRPGYVANCFMIEDDRNLEKSVNKKGRSSIRATLRQIPTNEGGE